jgi:dolichyl-phosphate-mannose-protein mannosyltransferase
MVFFIPKAQIYLIGNILLWYSATIGLAVYAAFAVFYLLRRRRLIHDLDPVEWDKFCNNGEVYFIGYLVHYLPYFFLERTMFLHNYFPALIFKILLLCFVLEHIFYVLKRKVKVQALTAVYKVLLFVWFTGVVYVYHKFSVLSYGTTKLSSDDVLNLRWKNTWDFILHKDLA